MDTNEAVESSKIKSANEGMECRNDSIKSDVESEEIDDDENIGEEEDTMSEYSYYASDDDDGKRVYNHPPTESKQNCDNREKAVSTVGDKRKAPGIEPLAELDSILNGIQDAVETSSPRNSSPVKAGLTSNNAPTAIATSTGIRGVGYEMGNNTTQSSRINESMAAAAAKQAKKDEVLQPLLSRLVVFIKNYDGSEGMVLLSLKMSHSFNRVLFDLLKNDSLVEWGTRFDIYDTTLDMLNEFSGSQFYVGMLLHDLVEGNCLPYDGKATCQALLQTLYDKATIMVCSHQKMGTSSSPTKEEAITIAMCNKIIASAEKMNAAIKSGRELGIVVNPENETTSKDISSSGPTHLMNALLAEAKAAPPLSLEEEKAMYTKEMAVHRLKFAEIIKTDGNNLLSSRYKFLSEATGQNTKSSSSVKKNRMTHITSEIAGLSKDLPVEWYSGIFVVVDEDRPDVLKACIIAPEGTPYQNGCFEFDIHLPLSYPDCPPKVHLVTTKFNSIRFNPNLYNCGKVCLSLLGTWAGPGWIPGTSTLLQVLLSIQSLIFVDRPFFNEPGYDPNSQIHKTQSDRYDRQIRAATLKVAIKDSIEHPPALFKDVIYDHFRLKKRQLLEQLDQWEEMEKCSDGVPEQAAVANAVAVPTIGHIGSSPLVAGGGLRSSYKIVKGICDSIRHLMELKYGDGEKEISNEVEES